LSIVYCRTYCLCFHCSWYACLFCLDRLIIILHGGEKGGLLSLFINLTCSYESDAVALQLGSLLIGTQHHSLCYISIFYFKCNPLNMRQIIYHVFMSCIWMMTKSSDWITIFITNLDIFPLILLSNIVIINKQTDTENDWSVWCQTHYDVADKIYNIPLKVSTNIITDHAIRLTVILAFMSVLTIISGSRCCSIFGFLCSVL